MVLSIWRAAPDRLRVELTGGVQDGAVATRVGATWWSSSPLQGVHSSDDCPTPAWLGEGADSFLDPANLIGALRFTTLGSSTRAARPVMIADAWPTSSPMSTSALRVLGAYADRYRLEVDTEYGLILSVHAYLDDGVFQTIDALDVHINEDIDPSLFRPMIDSC